MRGFGEQLRRNPKQRIPMAEVANIFDIVNKENVFVAVRNFHLITINYYEIKLLRFFLFQPESQIQSILQLRKVVNPPTICPETFYMRQRSMFVQINSPLIEPINKQLSGKHFQLFKN